MALLPALRAARPALRLQGLRPPTTPERVTASNPNKLLLDPHAKATVGLLDWSYPHFGYRLGAEEEDLSFDERDNAAGMPKCRVVETAFTGERR